MQSPERPTEIDEESRAGALVFLLLLVIATAILAFAVRTVTVGEVFEDGVPIVAPYDDLYHWKRIAYSAANFPAVLEHDPDRGLNGAFCPWPPLYDLGAAAIARAAGATDAMEVLRVVVWIPPIVAALLTGVVIFFLGRASPLAAGLAAVPLACGPFLVVSSWIGTLDHHFLEPFLVLGIAGGTILIIGAEDRTRAALAAAVLAAALITALFVQTALIVAAGVSFLCILTIGRRALPLLAGIGAFTLTAAAVVAYRMTRLPGFPDGPWFLGYVHAALLAGAGTALGVTLLLDRGQRRSMAATLLAIVTGALVAGSHPDAAGSLFSGLTFFGGEPWLSTIDEFQPVWKTLSRLPNYVAALALAAIASPLLLFRSRRGASSDLIIAVFAVAYIAATLPTRRFGVISTALGSVATAILLARLWRAVTDGGRWQRRSVMAMAALLIVIPPIQFALWWSAGTNSGMGGKAPDFIRTANLLRERGGPGRALVPWSYGHLFDVIGQRPVVVDNFGSMPDAESFRMAHAILLRTDERVVADFSDRWNVRYVVLEEPRRGLATHVRVTGLPVESFERDGRPTAHALATWYWRAWSGNELPAFRVVARIGPITVLERIRT